ncbi:MAG: class II fumarate hydratase [Candidatus Omnitrophica bacterium]|nr:class II fumarate hydratase [Candidatus Omnitrophota bacterium]
MKTEFRIAKDSMGEMQIPAHMLYGASTQRAVLNFPVSGLRLQRGFLEALGAVKEASAVVNRGLGKLDAKRSAAIVKACRAVSKGEYDEHFVVDVFQTGSGTSTNMNANEVIATLASKALPAASKVHPNDHVNMGQSSNDVIPTAMHVAAVAEINRMLLPALEGLHKSLKAKSKDFAKILKSGRTHLQDATPVTLGQEFGGHARQIELGIARVKAVLPHLRELAIGGTAVGTGLNTHPDFAKGVCGELSKRYNEKFVEAKDHFEAQAAKDAYVEASGALKTLAVSLTKICNDIRWLSSGPRTAFGETSIPATQPGSSIMPGKINPVMPEAVLMVAAQVIGNDLTISLGAASGNFELNVMMPVMAYNMLQSIECLANSVALLDKRCVQGLVANEETCRGTLEKNLSSCTALAPAVGYDTAAALSKEALATGKTIREIAKEKKVLPDKEIDRILDPSKMLRPR